MIFEEFYIFGHLIDFLFDFLELGIKTFEVSFELYNFLVAFVFLDFERDFPFVAHIIYQLLYKIMSKIGYKNPHNDIINNNRRTERLDMKDQYGWLECTALSMTPNIYLFLLFSFRFSL